MSEIETSTSVQSPNIVARYQFRHSTRYDYSGPVTFSPHRFVMRPREDHETRLESMQLTTTPESDIRWTEDITGNIIATAIFKRSAPFLEVVSEFVVAKIGHAGNPNAQGKILSAYPPYYLGIEENASYLYRRATYPEQVEKVRSWVLSQNILPARGQQGAVIDMLTHNINVQIGYQRREESGVQSPMKTLRLKTGSCRDTAVLLIEGARSLGFAARFVSGYMESSNSKVGRGSTHAWAEVYFPEHGWIGYDPSIGKRTGLGHVAVATSYHPRGIMPLSGGYNRHGNVYQGMTVSIHSEQLTAKPQESS